jgi:hypothetical protein
MTILVPMEKLAAVVATFGSAQLLTRPESGWVKVHTVDPVVSEESGEVRVVVPVEWGSCCRNAEADPHVSLVWASGVPKGWTLILDGWASVGQGEIEIRPDHAILHQPDAHADGPEWAWPE